MHLHGVLQYHQLLLMQKTLHCTARHGTASMSHVAAGTQCGEQLGHKEDDRVQARPAFDRAQAGQGDGSPKVTAFAGRRIACMLSVRAAQAPARCPCHPEKSPVLLKMLKMHAPTTAGMWG